MRVLPWIAGTVLSPLLFSGCQSQTPAPITTERVTPVKAVVVTQADLPRTTTQPATVHAFYRAEIRAQSTGYVRELNADIGDVVEAGTPLAVVDVPQWMSQRQVIEGRILSLQAAETQRQAGVELAKARVQSAQAQLAESESQLARVKAALAAATAEFDRTADLVQRQSLQDRLLDEARARRDVEQANLAAAESSIQSARAEVGVAEAQVVAAQAELQAAQAQTEIARSELREVDVLIEFATIRAPFHGVVTDRRVEPGDLVRAAGDTHDGAPLFVISQVDKLRIRVPVPETDAPLIDTGDEISLSFPSFTGESFTTQVTRTAGSLDPSTRTMIVEAEFDNPDGKLLPGMFGQATIQMSTQVAANMLPSRAVRFNEAGDAYVYLLGSDETVTITQVQTGLDDGSRIQIVAGLQPGQRVVDAHLKRFASGQKVGILD